MLIGFATLRLSGVYFVIFTLGLAEMIRNLVSWIQNNFLGLRDLYVLTDYTESHIYWMLLTVAFVVFMAGWRINRSRLGFFALRIIGSDGEIARHVGINTAWSKVILFMITGFFAALVGMIVAPRYSYIKPNVVFSPQFSFLVVIMALLGANGAGKSKLLRVIAGICEGQTDGRIDLSGKDILARKSDEIVEAGIAFVPEGRGIFGDLTVWENLMPGAYSQRRWCGKDRNLKWALELFPNLAERKNQVAHTMSGGEQQMVAIGRAMMANPEILMLD